MPTLPKDDKEFYPLDKIMELVNTICHVVITHNQRTNNPQGDTMSQRTYIIKIAPYGSPHKITVHTIKAYTAKEALTKIHTVLPPNATTPYELISIKWDRLTDYVENSFKNKGKFSHKTIDKHAKM